MSGQLTQVGAQFLGNKLSTQATPFIGAAHPATWIPGQEWINTTGSVLNVYDPKTAAWVTGPYQLYMALLTSDPTVVGPGGGLAQQISDLAAIEDTTTGYLRQPVTFGLAAASEPSSIFNSNLMTFGPYTANQAAPIGYTALMAVPAQFTASYTPLASTVQNGLLLYLWQVPNPQQVLSTQSIQIAANTFDIGIS